MVHAMCELAQTDSNSILLQAILRACRRYSSAEDSY